LAASQVTVADTEPPQVSCPQSMPVTECTGSGAAVIALKATATDRCGAVTLSNDRTTGGGDAGGSYPLGATAVTFVATDAAGQQTTCVWHVTVQDTLPPTISVHASPATLWPPNHQMIPVHTTLAAHDVCDPTVKVELVSVTSSEPDDAPGNSDGSTVKDIEG